MSASLGGTVRVSKVRWMALSAAAVLVLGASGCNNAVEGGLSGAAMGALGGMAIGSLSGDMGKGAAIGAVVGGLGGAVIGDQNERSSRNSRYGD
jgi:hypothetical protein